MKIKVSEASGKILDYLVAHCDGVVLEFNPMAYNRTIMTRQKSCDLGGGVEVWSPTTNWAQGGPIKEREKIATRFSDGTWYAMLSSDLGDGERAPWTKFTFNGVPFPTTTSRLCRFEGSSELIAAMRCYVASKLGQEAEVPDDLTI
jgi:hypothetical protein